MLKATKDLPSLKEELKARGVAYLIASFADMHGVSKAKVVPLGHLEHMMAGSELYTGAALDGVPQDVSDEDVSARPGVRTRERCTQSGRRTEVLPWRVPL